jgi:hypothetical protein
MCTTCSPPDTRARRLNPVTSLPSRPSEASESWPAGTLTEATREALTAVSRLDCPEGALAVMLAAQLDAGGHTGSQTAALSKEYRAALEVASKGATGAASTLDQLRARRAARRGA